MLNDLFSVPATAASLQWPEAVVAAVSIAIGGAILIVAVWRIMAIGQAHVAASADNDYRRLAEQSVAAQERTAAALDALIPRSADDRTDDPRIADDRIEGDR